MSPERACQLGAHVRLDQFGLGPADKIDLTYFETHRNRKAYRRKVIRGELTGSLRATGVRTVFVFQIVDGALLRAFEDKQRRLMSTSLFLSEKLLSTISGRAQVLMCLRFFTANAIGVSDERPA